MSILSHEFLVGVQGVLHRNLALALLQKFLNGEIAFYDAPEVNGSAVQVPRDLAATSSPFL